jgi:hypothetical protein
MYTLQNRADDFINEFENGSLQADLPKRYAIESLYQYVYAAKVLLDDDKWQGNVNDILSTIHAQNRLRLECLRNEGKQLEDYCDEDFNEILKNARTGNLRIWQYLLDKGLAPMDCRDEIISYGIQWAWLDSDGSYEDAFEVPLKDLLKWGGRKIDCDLYVAVQQLDFAKVEKLLQKGANPQAEIYVENPESFSLAKKVSSLGHAKLVWLSAYDAFDDLYITWENGCNKVDAEIPVVAFIQLMSSATHKMMYDLLSRYC